jgi:hypothetical protein
MELQTVRNRAKELGELLSDLERVRQERRKARQNKSKYGGIESSSGGFSSGGFNGSSSSRYGGFGSDSPGGLVCLIAMALKSDDEIHRVWRRQPSHQLFLFPR